jgi:hypothetical protein
MPKTSVFKGLWQLLEWVGACIVEQYQRNQV